MVTRTSGGKCEGMAARSNYPTVKVRRLQRALYMSAKRSRKRRFHALFDRICRGDVLAEAWERVRANKGAAGIDGETLSMIERLHRLLLDVIKDEFDRLGVEPPTHYYSSRERRETGEIDRTYRLGRGRKRRR